MKACHILAPLATAAACFLLPMAQAADATVTVTANVVGTCTFRTPTATLAFPDLPTDRTQPATAETTLNYQCANGSRYQLLVGGSTSGTLAGQLRSANNDSLAYSVAWTQPSNPIGLGFGDTTRDIGLQLQATIQPAAIQSAPQGAYTDTIIVTVNHD